MTSFLSSRIYNSLIKRTMQLELSTITITQFLGEHNSNSVCIVHDTTHKTGSQSSQLSTLYHLFRLNEHLWLFDNTSYIAVPAASWPGMNDQLRQVQINKLVRNDEN